MKAEIYLVDNMSWDEIFLCVKFNSVLSKSTADKIVQKFLEGAGPLYMDPLKFDYYKDDKGNQTTDNIYSIYIVIYDDEIILDNNRLNKHIDIIRESILSVIDAEVKNAVDYSELENSIKKKLTDRHSTITPLFLHVGKKLNIQYINP